MSARLSIAVVAVLAGLALAGCGERPQTISYKQGTYQGKPDEAPYAAAPFNGNKEMWERDIRARTQTALIANSSAPMSTIRPRKPCLCSSRPCQRAMP